MSGYTRESVPGYDTWVKCGDLTDDMVQDITNAQRRDAARWGELDKFDKEYGQRMRALRKDQRDLWLTTGNLGAVDPVIPTWAG